MERPTINRRRALTLLAGTGLASLLTACGTATAVSAPTAGQSATAAGPSATSVAASGSTTSATTSGAAAATSSNPAAGTANFTVLGFGTPDEQAALSKGLQQFMAVHPGTQVDLANPANSNNKLDTLIAAGTPPSTFTLSPFDMPGYVAKGAISPIDAYVAAAHYDLTDFYPKALNQYYWKGKLYGLPRGFGNQDLYWNVDMFSKAGVPVPAEKWADPAWMTDAFLTTAQRLTVRTGSTVSQYGYAQTFGLRQWEPWVWIFGGSVVDADNQKCLLGEAPAIAGLQFLADLMHKHQVMATPADLKTQNLGARFAANQLGMAMGIPANLVTYRKLKAPAWDVAPLPTQKATLTSGGGIAWMMIAGSPQPDLTWDLVAWMAGTQVQTLECNVAGTAPPRQSIATSACYNDPSQPPKHMSVFLEAPAYVHADPQIVNWDQVDAMLEPGLTAIWNGTKTANEALPPLVKQINAIIQVS